MILDSDDSRHLVGGRTFVTWIVASIAGSAAGIPLSNWMGSKGARSLAFLIPAILTATFQWVLCLRRIIQSYVWIALSTIGRIGFLFNWFWLWFFFKRATSPYITDSINFEWYVIFAISAAVAGALLGLLQWLILRRVFDRAAWWILATAIGSAIAWSYRIIAIDFNLSGVFDLFANTHAITAATQGLLFIGVLRVKRPYKEVTSHSSTET